MVVGLSEFVNELRFEVISSLCHRRIVDKCYVKEEREKGRLLISCKFVHLRESGGHC